MQFPPERSTTSYPCPKCGQPMACGWTWIDGRGRLMWSQGAEPPERAVFVPRKGRSMIYADMFEEIIKTANFCKACRLFLIEDVPELEF